MSTTTTQSRRDEMRVAMDEFKAAARSLSAKWDTDEPFDCVKDYPSYLPSFDEFVCDLETLRVVPTYAEACTEAATEQGLDPFTRAARAAGLPVDVWQTGGFCMVAAIPSEREGYFYTTSCDADDELAPYIVCLHNPEAEDDAEFVEVASGVSATDAVAIIRKRLDAAPRTLTIRITIGGTR